MITNRSSSTTKRPRSRWASVSGFTLVEVCMASFVMLFGLASSIVTLKSGFRDIDLARGTTIAAQVMQSEMERLRLMNWAAIYALPATETFDGATNFSTSPKLAGKYTVIRTATADTTRPTEVKNIMISVTWKSSDQISHTRSITAIYAKNGLYDYYYTFSH